MSLTRTKPSWKVILIACAIIAGIGRRYFDGNLGEGFAVAAGLFFVVKSIQGVASASRRIRFARSQSSCRWNIWREVIPPWIRGFAYTEMLIYQEFFFRLTRLKTPSMFAAERLPSGRRFRLDQGNVATLLVPLAIIGLISDVPVSQVIISILAPKHAIWIHIATLAIAVWGFIWIVGDRMALRTLVHILGQERLFLRVGFRWSCDMPISAIVGCSALSGRSKEWQALRSVSKSEVWSVTPIDAPNVLIELDQEMLKGVSVERMATCMPPRRYVALYVDMPGEFLRDVVITQKSLQSKKPND